MATPFSGFVVPPLMYSVGLLVGVSMVLAFLYLMNPPVTQKIALSFAPWMVTGALLHVFWRLGEHFNRWIYPQNLNPLFSAPAVYVTTFIVMGMVWVVAGMVIPREKHDKLVSQYIAGAGTGIVIILSGLLIWQGTDPAVAPMEPIMPVVGLIVALGLTFVVYFMIGMWRAYVIAQARLIGLLVIFAHLFDGITTAIGVDLLGHGEQSTLSRFIINFAADLPTASTIGSGWLFVLVKLVLASAIVVLFADYVKDEPRPANIFLATIAAVGLGPATHNFFLFILSL